MKKVLSIIIALVCLGTAVNAQRNIKLAPAMTIPSTITVGQQFPMTIIFTNNGPDSILAGDTVAYRDPTGPAQAGQFYILTTTKTKAMGDTFVVTKQLTLNSGTNGPATFCAYGFVTNGPLVVFDTTGWRGCANTTISGGTNVGINEFVVSESVTAKKINIYPNPVVGNEINVDYVAINTSEVVANVYDLTGRKVMSHSFGKAFKGQEGYGLDVSALNSGMYIMEIRQDGIKATGQFVK